MISLDHTAALTHLDIRSEVFHILAFDQESPSPSKGHGDIGVARLLGTKIGLVVISVECGICHEYGILIELDEKEKMVASLVQRHSRC